jgi:hypothetical protein
MRSLFIWSEAYSKKVKISLSCPPALWRIPTFACRAILSTIAFGEGGSLGDGGGSFRLSRHSLLTAGGPATGG